MTSAVGTQTEQVIASHEGSPQNGARETIRVEDLTSAEDVARECARLNNNGHVTFPTSFYDSDGQYKPGPLFAVPYEKFPDKPPIWYPDARFSIAGDDETFTLDNPTQIIEDAVSEQGGHAVIAFRTFDGNSFSNPELTRQAIVASAYNKAGFITHEDNTDDGRYADQMSNDGQQSPMLIITKDGDSFRAKASMRLVGPSGRSAVDPYIRQSDNHPGDAKRKKMNPGEFPMAAYLSDAEMEAAHPMAFEASQAANAAINGNIRTATTGALVGLLEPLFGYLNSRDADQIFEHSQTNSIAVGLAARREIAMFIERKLNKSLLNKVGLRARYKRIVPAFRLIGRPSFSYARHPNADPQPHHGVVYPYQIVVKRRRIPKFLNRSPLV